MEHPNQRDQVAAFTAEMKAFVLGEHLTDYDAEYWISITRGIVLLFKYRDLINDKDIMMQSYFSMRNDLLNAQNVPAIFEDFLDEFQAIFIRWYPMPDFWTGTLADFKAHINFKERFEELNRRMNE